MFYNTNDGFGPEVEFSSTVNYQDRKLGDWIKFLYAIIWKQSR